MDNFPPNFAKTKRGANGKFLPKSRIFSCWKIPLPRLAPSRSGLAKLQAFASHPPFPSATSALFRHLPEYLEGRTPKRKMSFPFLEKIGRAQIRKARNIFSFWDCRVKRGGGGTIRAYDLVSSHHALRACDIICFGNRF